MKKQNVLKKIIVILIIGIVLNGNVFATSVLNNTAQLEYTDEFKEWIELDKTERQEVLMPRMYNIEYTQVEYYNPLKSARLLASNPENYFCLNDADVIPENVIVKDQMDTGACWAFSSISSLETNLALKNKYNGIKPITYDFSERHMEYATSRNFTDGVNANAFNRSVGGGNWLISSTYLTNGTGAIPENQMEFENNENKISISEIQGKTVTSQVYDTIEFPNSKPTEVTDEMINQIKNHIKNYGSVFANIHSDCCNFVTGGMYCDGSDNGCVPDHAVSIIGWNDEYLVSNFNENQRPSNPGAWIIKNSWGEEKVYNLAELKAELFETYKTEFIEAGISEASAIPNEFITLLGYTIEGDTATLPVGDDGIMYVSYEDKNIYSGLAGIVKASDYTDYENIYQYNYLGYSDYAPIAGSKIYIGNIYNKKTSGTEYLTQVGINVLESCDAKVYVGNSLESIQPVELKAGQMEKLDGAGYHTLEFANPIQITSNQFAVVVELQGTNIVLIEARVESTPWDDAQIENNKCFVTNEQLIGQNLWVDLSKASTQISPEYTNGDSTIKAFTTSKIEDNTLNRIEVTTKPKTEYYVGENFDKTGMVVTAYYNNGKTSVIDDDGYSIENGTNLQKDQTSVTIKYQDKSYELTITVLENTVVSIRVKNPPSDTEYKAGEDFDTTGMIIEATYRDGTVKDITDYEVVDGNDLKNEQTSVTIKCGEATTTYEIKVLPNPVVGLRIEEGPDKEDYVVGQDFDSTGMIVIAIYEDGTEKAITGYTIENGEDLSIEQTEVTIKYENQTTTQDITVVAKTVESIQVSKMPDKVQYIQNKESLDLTGGTILVTYNDETTETISMTDDDVIATGFNNQTAGTIQVTLTYQTKVATFTVTIIEPVTAKNSNLDNAKCEVLKVQSYTFTDPTQEEYIIMELEINDIVRNLENDRLEYYYYLSSNQNESNIQNWVKITESQTNANKLVFKINTKDISNYDEIVSADVLYLYIREIAVKGGDQKVEVSKSMVVESHVGLEEYLDNVKQDPNAKPDEDITEENDDTVSKDKIPNAGKRFIVIITIITTAGIILISYKKYRELKEVK